MFSSIDVLPGFDWILYLWEHLLTICFELIKVYLSDISCCDIAFDSHPWDFCSKSFYHFTWSFNFSQNLTIPGLNSPRTNIVVFSFSSTTIFNLEYANTKAYVQISFEKGLMYYCTKYWKDWTGVLYERTVSDKSLKIWKMWSNKCKKANFFFLV